MDYTITDEGGPMSDEIKTKVYDQCDRCGVTCDVEDLDIDGICVDCNDELDDDDDWDVDDPDDQDDDYDCSVEALEMEDEDWFDEEGDHEDDGDRSTAPDW